MKYEVLWIEYLPRIHDIAVRMPFQPVNVSSVIGIEGFYGHRADPKTLLTGIVAVHPLFQSSPGLNAPLLLSIETNVVKPTFVGPLVKLGISCLLFPG